MSGSRSRSGGPIEREEPQADLSSPRFDGIDQRAHEERLQVLYEQSSDGYLVFDENGIIDCNPAVIQMLRCTDKKHMLSLHPAQLSPEYVSSWFTS